MRNTLNIKQGSDQWLAVRQQHFTASEAPAMAGVSKYQTRTNLLDQKKSGIAKEVDAHTQALFDKGHAAEANARGLAEIIIGDELSPVTMTFDVNGLKLLASLDGITFDGETIWEHKLWNEKLADAVMNNHLPEQYKVQLDQQLIVSGAKKALFMVSDGTKEKMVHCWYETDMTREDALMDGWKQFAFDLENHVPTVHIEKVEAEQVQALPVPSVVVRGEITTSNLSEITPKFDAYLSGIKTELSTDTDFADAEANAKNCRETAKRIEALQGNIIAQMVSVNEVNSTLENYKEAFNKIGLKLEKAVKEQKETLKTNAVMKARNDYSDFITALNKDCIVVLHQNLVAPDFAAAIKGIKTIESMHSRINDALAKGKVEATTLANEIKAKIEFINEASKGYEHLINVPHLATANLDYIKLYLAQVKGAEDKRKADHEAAIKAQAELDAHAKLAQETNQKAPVEVAPVNHIVEANKMIETATPPTQYFYSNEPTVNEIVCAVAASFKVDEMQAHKWLLDADFTKFEMKKAA